MLQPAYKGNDKYIFISYAHKDSSVVYPFIEELQKSFNVWYDEGIRYGREWEEEILEKLNGSYIFLFCVTENSLLSENCNDEIYKAREEKKNFINIVFNSKISLSEKFMFRYGRYQMCYVDKFNTYTEVVSNLVSKCDWFELVKSNGASEINTNISLNTNTIQRDIPHIVSTSTLPPSPYEDLMLGESFFYGDYDSGAGKQPIKWNILAIEKDRILVTTDQILDVVPYNKTKTDVCWENSSIRNWLNDYFYNSAFTVDDKERILLTDVVNKANPKYGTSGGKNTKDKIFLLSEDEVLKYYPDFKKAKCSSVDAIRGKLLSKKEEFTNYWLRSPGSKGIKASIVTSYDSIDYSWNVNSSFWGVRPAMYLKLNNIIDPNEVIKYLAKFKNLRVGDIVEFGKYEQGTGKAALPWKVLSISDDKALLITKELIDCVPYNLTNENVTWETASLRSWLNSVFISSSFSKIERSIILDTEVKGENNEKFKTNGGNDVVDNVFILSISEIDKYLPFDNSRVCSATDYCRTKLISKKEKTSCWWVRNSGRKQSKTVSVDWFGNFDHSLNCDDTYICIRPALWIRFK